MFEKAKSSAKRLASETALLFRELPSWVVVSYGLSVVLMNLFANKSIDLGGTPWLSLDCGIVVAWLGFLIMDMVTKRFGPRASVTVSVSALLANLVAVGLFAAAAAIPGFWGASYDVSGEYSAVVNAALDATIGGTWYVLLGSSAAFLASSVTNSLMNWLVGRAIGSKRNATRSFGEFAVRAYASTLVGQFVDNLVFAFIVSYNFFGWTPLQCVGCAFFGAVAELLCEVVLSPVGYRVVRKWEREGVGSKYIEAVAE